MGTQHLCCELIFPGTTRLKGTLQRYIPALKYQTGVCITCSQRSLFFIALGSSVHALSSSMTEVEPSLAVFKDADRFWCACCEQKEQESALNLSGPMPRSFKLQPSLSLKLVIYL